MRDASLVADLECSGCGRPLVRDGCFKCTRCDRLVHATLGEKRIYCPDCSAPRVLLARNDEALCPESKKSCPNRRDSKGTPMKLVMKGETQMKQETVVAEENPPAGGSKTQELRDWLSKKSDLNSEAWFLLDGALMKADDPECRFNYALDAYKMRYGGLTPDERSAKIAEDREKLKEVQKRLELLRSARELDVDIDAMERLGLKVDIVYRPESLLPVCIDASFYAAVPTRIRLIRICIILPQRRIDIHFGGGEVSVSGLHIYSDVTRFSLNERTRVISFCSNPLDSGKAWKVEVQFDASGRVGFYQSPS